MTITTCTTTGKITYHTPAQAMRTMRSIYRCEACKGWHVLGPKHEKPFEEPLPSVGRKAKRQPRQPWEPQPRRRKP